MSSYFFELYYSEKVTRPHLEEKIAQIPGVTAGPEGLDHFWVGGVHLVFHDEDLELIFHEIEHHTGIVTGDFSLSIGVHNRSQESTDRMLDVLLPLLAEHDAVALLESDGIVLWQQNGQLTVDTTLLGQATQDYIAAARPCRFAPLGPLQGPG